MGDFSLTSGDGTVLMEIGQLDTIVREWFISLEDYAANGTSPSDSSANDSDQFIIAVDSLRREFGIDYLSYGADRLADFITDCLAVVDVQVRSDEIRHRAAQAPIDPDSVSPVTRVDIPEARTIEEAVDNLHFLALSDIAWLNAPGDVQWIFHLTLDDAVALGTLVERTLGPAADRLSDSYKLYLLTAQTHSAKGPERKMHESLLNLYVGAAYSIEKRLEIYDWQDRRRSIVSVGRLVSQGVPLSWALNRVNALNSSRFGD